MAVRNITKDTSTKDQEEGNYPGHSAAFQKLVQYGTKGLFLLMIFLVTKEIPNWKILIEVKEVHHCYRCMVVFGWLVHVLVGVLFSTSGSPQSTFTAHYGNADFFLSFAEYIDSNISLTDSSVLALIFCEISYGHGMG